MNYTAVIKPDGDYWIGWIEEISGVNCQGSTKEELLKSLKATLIEAIEFNREEARKAAGTNWMEEVVSI